MTMLQTVFDEAGRHTSALTPVAGPRIGAVIAPCSARKVIVAEDRARAVSLPHAAQSALEAAWQLRLSDLPTSFAAGNLYRGRGFGTAGRAAVRAQADFLIASAGLGLVRANRDVPAYGLTVTGVGGPDAVRSRIVGCFNPASWWRALQNGPYAIALSDVFLSDGLVLVALSHTYADLLSEDLASLNVACLTRLRITGAGLERHLPERVRKAALLPYDDRLDRLLPGVRGEFCQRALSHFVDLLTNDGVGNSSAADIKAHRILVDDALGPAQAGTSPRRSRVTDEVIVQRISAHLSTSASGPSAARMLRALRDEDGIACEASRFVRLFRRAIQTEPQGGAR